MILVQALRIEPKPIDTNPSFTRILDLPKKSVTETVARRSSVTSLMKQCSVESDTQTIKRTVSMIVGYVAVLSKIFFYFQEFAGS